MRYLRLLGLWDAALRAMLILGETFNLRQRTARSKYARGSILSVWAPRALILVMYDSSSRVSRYTANFVIMNGVEWFLRFQ